MMSPFVGLVMALLCMNLPSLAQVDTLAALSSLPLQQGNRWQYDAMIYPPIGQPYYDGTDVIEVGPWIQQSNGLLYRELRGIDLFFGGVGDNHRSYVRLDSTRLAVLQYMGEFQEWGECDVDEEVRIDLATASYLVFENCQGLVSSYYQTWPVFGVDTPSIRTGCLWHTSVLSQGMGFSWFGIGDLDMTRLTLRAAHIDSVDYGDWVNVAPQPIPQSMSLSIHAWPNPFNSNARICYEIQAQADVEVSVYDLLGNRVAVLADGPQASGWHEAVLDGSDWASGLYIVKLEADGRVGTQKLLLLR